jgi:hypothetical protein
MKSHFTEANTVERMILEAVESLGGAARAEAMRETPGWGPSIGDELHRRGIQAGRRPTRHRAMALAITDAGLDELWVVYPGTRSYALDDRITVRPLHECLAPR